MIEHNMMWYKRIDHDADLRIHVFGNNIQALFENAGLAVAELIADFAPQPVDQIHRISVSGIDWPDLMFYWLREVLCLWTIKEQMVLEIHQLHITEFELQADVGAISFDPLRHQVGSEIKAVTYHQLEVTQGISGWEAKIIFDT